MASDWRDDIRELIEAVAERLNLHVMKRSVMAGAGVGAVSAGLGMFFGPPGLVAGAAVGGVVMAWMNADGEKCLIDVLKELAGETKEKLYTGVKVLLQEWVWPTVNALLEKVLENEKLMNKITDFIKSFFEPLRMIVVAR